MKKLQEKQFWKGGNMLYPLPAVMVSCGREGEKLGSFGYSIRKKK